MNAPDSHPCDCCKTGVAYGYNFVCAECAKMLAQDDNERRLADALALVEKHEAMLEDERRTYVW